MDGRHWVGILRAGPLSKTLTGNLTMSTTDAANGWIQFLGSPGADPTVTVPSDFLGAGHIWLIQNAMGASRNLTFIGPTGTGAVLRNGESAFVTADGTNIVRATNSLGPGTLTAAMLATALAQQLPTVGITISAEVANVMTVTVQVKDAAGNNLSQNKLIDILMSDALYGADAAAAPSGGLAVTTGVLVNSFQANIRIRAWTNSSGVLVFTITEVAAKTFYAHAVMGNQIAAAAAAFV